MNRKQKIILLSILFFAAILRLWKLGSVPPGLTPDEASLGYNAYSILKTGRDEYGKLLPIVFKSFGDYKPGLYVYTAIPFVELFGLNEWSVRLSSALAGILIVYLIYRISSLLITKHVHSDAGILLSIIVAFVAATNPWLIYFSRGAWEANLSLALTLAGVYFFIKSLREEKLLIFSTLFFSLTLLAYQGAKLSTFLVVIILLIIYWREFWQKFSSSKTIIVSVILGFVVSLPIVLSLFSGQAGRLSVFSIFSYPRSEDYLNGFLSQGAEGHGELNYYTFHSESLNFARGIMGRWFNHFSGKFLFFSGDYQNPKQSAPNSGMLLLIDLILLPLGFVFILKSKFLNPKFKRFILLWLVLSPLPAVLSRDQVQATRALNMSIPLVLVSSFGLYYLLRLSTKFRYGFFCYLILPIAYLASFIYFVDSYFVHLPTHNAKYWFYGFKETVNNISKIENNYDRIIFQQSYSQPYIYFLFYQRYDPKIYQAKSKFKSGGSDVGLVESLDNIEFISLSWPPPVDGRKTLVVGDSVAIPGFYSTDQYNLISELKYPDNVITAFRILETK